MVANRALSFVLTAFDGPRCWFSKRQTISSRPMFKFASAVCTLMAYPARERMLNSSPFPTSTSSAPGGTAMVNLDCGST